MAEIAPNVIIVNKEIYLSSLRALGVFLEQTSDIYEQVRTSEYPKDVRNLLLSILNEQIEAISNISQAIEASIENGLDPDKSKGLLN